MFEVFPRLSLSNFTRDKSVWSTHHSSRGTNTVIHSLMGTFLHGHDNGHNGPEGEDLMKTFHSFKEEFVPKQQFGVYYLSLYRKISRLLFSLFS